MRHAEQNGKCAMGLLHLIGCKCEAIPLEGHLPIPSDCNAAEQPANGVHFGYSASTQCSSMLMIILAAPVPHSLSLFFFFFFGNCRPCWSTELKYLLDI